MKDPGFYEKHGVKVEEKEICIKILCDGSRRTWFYSSYSLQKKEEWDRIFDLSVRESNCEGLSVRCFLFDKSTFQLDTSIHALLVPCEHDHSLQLEGKEKGAVNGRDDA